LALPLAGLLADRITLKTFLIIGVIFFFLDGFWIAAALTGMVVFAVLANFFDGLAVASDVVGRSTYVRRFTPPMLVGSVMGFQDTLVNLGWAIGAILNVFAVQYLPLPWIFFMVLPANLVALLLLAFYLPSRSPVAASADTAVSFKNYWGLWQEVFRWKYALRSLVGIMFLLYALNAIGSFIIPIHAFTEGASLSFVILLKIAVIAPVLFSAVLGRVADRLGSWAFPWGMVIISVLIALLAFLSDYRFHLIINLLLGSILVLLSLMIERMVTERVQPARYGRVTAVFEGVKNAAGYVGAISLGFLLDGLGAFAAFVSISVIVFILALYFGRKHRDLIALEASS
jgi:MFS family permease